MNPAPFVHSALAMTRRLKRRDRCPARLALGCLEVTEFSRYPGMADIGQACTHQARFVSTRPGPTGRYPGHEYCFAKG